MNYWFIFLKMIAIYFGLIIVLRILGKREVGQLSIFDLVVLLIIADIASLGIDNDEFVFPSYFCVFILVLLQKALSILSLKKAFFRNLIDGSPVTIVLNGKLLIKNMRKEHYTVDDLVSQMRMYHIMDIDEIKLAILETNGTLSIFRSSRFDKIKLPVIISGNLLKESIELLNVDIELFKEALLKNDLNYKKLIYASLHNDTLLYYDKKDSIKGELSGHKLKLMLKDTKDYAKNNYIENK